MQVRWLGGLLAAAAILSATSVAQAQPENGASATAAAQRATMRTFQGLWYGHSRSLTIGRRGHATESVGDGCCDPIIDLRFRLRHPRGTTSRATARAKVTWVRVRNKHAFTKAYPAPHVGQVGTVRLRHGVLDEPFLDTNYCTLKQQMKGACGA